MSKISRRKFLKTSAKGVAIASIPVFFRFDPMAALAAPSPEGMTLNDYYLHFGVDERAAAHVVEGLPGEGHIKLAADLGDPAAAAQLSELAADGLGRLDIVVNNAGIFVTHDISHLDRAHWQKNWNRTIAVNLSGPAHVLHGAQ